MFEEIKNILVEQLSVEESLVTPDANLVNDLGVNSLELADLVLFCEEKYDIVIGEEDIHNFETVGDIDAYLSEKTGR